MANGTSSTSASKTSAGATSATSAEKASARVSAEAAGLAFQITSLEDEFEYLNMLVYGPPGAGKTTLCASAADIDDMADVLMIDIESGTLTIKNNDRVKRKDRIDAVRVTSFKQLAKVHEFLKLHCRLRDMPSEEGKLKQLEAKFKGVAPEKIKKPRRYRSVIIDSLSELDALCIYELLGFSTDMKLDEALNDGDMEVAEWAEYKKNNQMMQLIVRAYRDLPISVLLSCHSAHTQDEMKRMHYAPSLTGKLRNQVQGFVDLVGFLKVGELGEGQKQAPRRLYYQPVGKFDAKSRLANLKESYFDNPTMTDVWRAINK